MALFLFADAILNDRPINVYNYGRMKRDFTYIGDVVEGTIAALERPFAYEVFNLGNSDPIELMDFIGIIEEELGYACERLRPEEAEDRAVELIGLFREYAKKHGVELEEPSVVEVDGVPSEGPLGGLVGKVGGVEAGLQEDPLAPVIELE